MLRVGRGPRDIPTTTACDGSGRLHTHDRVWGAHSMWANACTVRHGSSAASVSKGPVSYMHAHPHGHRTYAGRGNRCSTNLQPGITTSTSFTISHHPTHRCQPLKAAPNQRATGRGPATRLLGRSCAALPHQLLRDRHRSVAADRSFLVFTSAPAAREGPKPMPCSCV